MKHKYMAIDDGGDFFLMTDDNDVLTISHNYYNCGEMETGYYEIDEDTAMRIIDFLTKAHGLSVAREEVAA